LTFPSRRCEAWSGKSQKVRNGHPANSGVGRTRQYMADRAAQPAPTGKQGRHIPGEEGRVHIPGSTLGLVMALMSLREYSRPRYAWCTYTEEHSRPRYAWALREEGGRSLGHVLTLTGEEGGRSLGHVLTLTFRKKEGGL